MTRSRTHLESIAADWPIGALGGELATLPRASLGRIVSPIEQASDVAPELWIKRDDLNAPRAGGNKVRALEMLLAGVPDGSHVVTVGGWASTHVLATAMHAESLGSETIAYRWAQEMSDVAREVAARNDVLTLGARVRTPVGAMLRAAYASWRGAHSIPAGGTSSSGMIGHVNAAFELAEQVRVGIMPEPARIVLPLGSGGTVAGLWVGTRLAGLGCEVVGARVVPRIVANQARVRWLARSVTRRLSQLTGRRLNTPSDGLTIAHESYGGAYGREWPAARAAAIRLARHDEFATADPTYAAKALARALALADGRPTLFWLTFDGRMLR